MTISKIVTLNPAGSFQVQGKTLFKFLVSLEDGTAGECNSTKQQPWYSVGTPVAYEVTGDFKGTKKLKVSRPEGSPVAFAEAKPYGGASPAAKQAAMEKRDDSITASWAIGRACDLYIHSGFKFDAHYSSHIWRIAKKLALMQECMVNGTDYEAELPSE